MAFYDTQTAPVPKEKHWLLGNLAGMIKDPLNYLSRVQQQEGNIVHLTSPLVNMYVVYDAEGIRHVLQDNNKNYVKGKLIHVLKPLFGNGLVLNEGDFWRKQRRLIQPAFNKERYGEMIRNIIQCVQELIQQWDAEYPDGAEINISKEMNKLALRVVAKALFKTDIEENIPVINQNLAYVLSRMFKRFNNPVLHASWVPTPANFKEKKNINSLNKIILDIIKAKQEGRIPKSGDIMDMLMEVKDEDTNEKMSVKQLRDEVMTLILAGHETTANGMSFMWHTLSCEPAVMKKIDAEAKHILEQGPLQPQSLLQAVYIRQVIHETLRLYPPGALIQRRTIADDTICGCHIPKQKDVLLPIYVIHRMKEYWENPEKFDPERFNPEKIKQLPKFAFFPFGGGPRLCIGDQFATYEMAITLLIISQKYTFSAKNDKPLEVQLDMALRPKEDIILKIYRR